MDIKLVITLLTVNQEEHLPSQILKTNFGAPRSLVPTLFLLSTLALLLELAPYLNKTGGAHPKVDGLQ